MKKLGSLLLCFLSLGLALMGLVETHWVMGFHIGDITDYQRIMLWTVDIGASLLIGLAVYFIYGGWFAEADKQFRHLFIGAGCLAALLLVLFVIHYLALRYWGPGQGG